MMFDGVLYVDGVEVLVGLMNVWLVVLVLDDVVGVFFIFDMYMFEIYVGLVEVVMFLLYCMCGMVGWWLVFDLGGIDMVILLYWLEKNVFVMWEELDVMIGDLCDLIVLMVLCEVFFEGLKVDGIVEVIVIGVVVDYCVCWVVEGLIVCGFCVIVFVVMMCGIVW